MKTIESMSELKKVYDKPQMEVEEMEVQWSYCDCCSGDTTNDASGGGNNSGGGSGDEF